MQVRAAPAAFFRGVIHVMPKTKTFWEVIKANPLPWMVQIVTSFFFIGNLYMATQLFPLIRNIDSLVSRVVAVESEVTDRAPLVERFIQLEERDKRLVEDVAEIKENLKEIGRAHGLLMSD